MFKNIMRDTAPRRALAAIINTLDIEIITRRDTAKTSQDRAELRMFILAHKSFTNAWNALNPETNPISYAIAWDTHLTANRRFNVKKFENLVRHYVENILSEVAVDIENLLPVSNIENIRAGEQALADIVTIDKKFSIA